MSSPDLRPLLVREGLLSENADVPDELDAAKVVDLKLVSEDVLADLLAREAGSVVIDLERGTLESEAVGLLAQSLARRSLAVPVALEPGRQAIQVAFANPLDTGTLAAVAASTGCEVRALVATVTAIRRTLDREYGPEPSPTVVLGHRRSSPPPKTLRDQEPAARSSSDSERTRSRALVKEISGEFRAVDAESSDASVEQPIPPESTRRLPEEGPVTLPVHRLEAEASIEQRFEALMSVLVERGAVSRAEYADALKRLLKR